jgi:translation initiation factor 3 subunit L
MLQNGPSHQDRTDSFNNYCEIFNYILHPEDNQPVQLELPNQWLWDIIDEFIYQFQNYSQYRSKLQSKSQEEITAISDALDENVWGVHSVLNVLQTLVTTSRINQQLSAYNEKKSMDEVHDIGGIFGQTQLYKMLGYFSLIGLLRLQCQLGDYHQVNESIGRVLTDISRP